MRPIVCQSIAALVLATNIAFAQKDDSWASRDQAAFTPKIHHPNISAVTLFAQNPDIVTPVGVAVAPDGRVFVQENHTHQRGGNYAGPATDRILVFEDTNGDGVGDKRSVFYEGHTYSTDLLFGPDGHLYVSTRWFVGRFRDAANRQVADREPEKLVVCETDGDYPHNGVGGLAIDPANPDWLAFGFGENLGAEYTFVGSDGIRLSGGAEGGSTYRCRTDGANLTRQSTGHWNAFGMAFDLDGNLFSTDNDPNATPPNRLLHVVPGADFGYEYRYGRSGRHPLVCWYGENPGTIGMIGALGEAACGLVAHGPGQLLSASWTDNRIDLHALKPKGASFIATREPFLSGPDNFRPVHLSYAADGKTLYFTDWVKVSYPVHGHGRIWRVELKEPVQLTPLSRQVNQGEISPDLALQQLGSDDPYVRTEAVRVLSQNPNVLYARDWQSDANPVARAHRAVAMKRHDPSKHADVIPLLLGDTDPMVRFVGIKWIADEGLVEHKADLERLLNRADLTRRDLFAIVASLAKIGSDSSDEFSPGDTMLELALDAQKPVELRAIAMENVRVDHPRLTLELLSSLAKEENVAIQREAIRSLALHPDGAKTSILGELANDPSVNPNSRADAIAGLTADQSALLQRLANDDHPAVAAEARRTLDSTGVSRRLLPPKPPADDIARWQALVDEATEEPDPLVGRRLFFHPVLGGCYKCHAMNGRGNQIGPELTTIRNQSGMTSGRLLHHIVNPDAEMAPYYRPQQLLTHDGTVLTGLVVGKEGKRQAYLGNDGVLFFVDKDDIEERRELTTSIMPSGLLDNLTAGEIGDLIAYLLQNDES